MGKKYHKMLISVVLIIFLVMNMGMVLANQRAHIPFTKGNLIIRLVHCIGMSIVILLIESLKAYDNKKKFVFGTVLTSILVMFVGSMVGALLVSKNYMNDSVMSELFIVIFPRVEIVVRIIAFCFALSFMINCLFKKWVYKNDKKKSKNETAEKVFLGVIVLVLCYLLKGTGGAFSVTKDDLLFVGGLWFFVLVQYGLFFFSEKLFQPNTLEFFQENKKKMIMIVVIYILIRFICLAIGEMQNMGIGSLGNVVFYW